MVSTPFFLRAALFGGADFDPPGFCHHPLVVRDLDLPRGRVWSRLTGRPEEPGDDVIDEDMILLWTDAERCIITGSDLIGRLLRRIARPAPITTP